MVSQQGVNKWFSRTTIDHRVGPEGGGDGRYALDQLLDEEVFRRGVAAGEVLDLIALRSGQAIDIEDGVDLGIQTALRQEVAISLRRGGEAAGRAGGLPQ
jgi:hypothetical protein